MGTTETLAAFLVETGLGDLPAGVIDRGKQLLIDFISGALGGSRTRVGLWWNGACR